MKTYRLLFMGFGTIGRALIRLLQEKESALRETYGAILLTTAVVTHRHGIALDPGGLDMTAILRLAESGLRIGDRSTEQVPLEEILHSSKADFFLENTPTDRGMGEPAATHIRIALRNGLHLVTANKGPAAYAYRELRDLVRSAGQRFLFEATVMDGTPVFSLFRETLLAVRVIGFRAILNSTTNYLLTRMENGLDFEEAVQAAQTIGIAETDPMADVDVWDATLKVAILANVLMDYPLRVEEIAREGMGRLDPQAVRRARAEDRPFKLVCRAQRTAAGLSASVRPEQVSAGDPLASVRGTATMLSLETDMLPGLISSGEASPARGRRPTGCFRTYRGPRATNPIRRKGDSFRYNLFLPRECGV
jgi:homoserine dehydrogenase